MSNNMNDQPLTGNGYRPVGRMPDQVVFQQEKARGMTAALMMIAGRRHAANRPRPGRHRADG